MLLNEIPTSSERQSVSWTYMPAAGFFVFVVVVVVFVFHFFPKKRLLWVYFLSLILMFPWALNDLEGTHCPGMNCI